MKIYDHVERAAHEAVALAERARQCGTFGVGGVLIDGAGQIVARARNRVIDTALLNDPTAHVERQLVDWYFAQRLSGTVLPPPEELTIVSSLEPCMMCAGAILASGFHCIAIAEDEFSAVGISSGCSHLPQSLRPIGVQSLFLFRVVRERDVPYASLRGEFDVTLPRDLLLRAQRAFFESLDQVHAVFQGATKAPKEVHDGLDADTVQCSLTYSPADVWVKEHDASRGSMRETLRTLQRHPNDLVAGFTDLRGDIICAARGHEDRSPARTAVLEAVRLVVGTARDSTEGLDPRKMHMVLLGRFTSEASAICSIGAIGSLLERPPEPASGAYIRVLDASPEPIDELRALIANFPKFYTSFVGLRVQPV